ncbi:NADH-quinone oxidoreductase subunit NuoK [Tuwongella immobilis]|uniref:NADH-quinone oxidoreductase subunit K n=1 Tax=Tuwongella immobilis TaxID=692036 RepID=A0A6C2YI10_9BACT|nr:NADH-quinone oxidoreductase subunit NuoK [Tuwongella immobilis]VIP00901.1 nadh-quinone oxidoreductase subunit k : NADH-quinone oxidoreductase subunit K OS=Singulisphaera acidiphila (strain ATCC BAA-1392 / DSM 18658 / VKM B-2454 / MOB10) GN=nuoK PE=3 SV=1: Oxidored_q2 [Tuwongella immobilis]VTR97220.1 nadh-quinone oxidoreductase subunit k : NADH-quinone oxidoreductase subunit K OS=Singulisphaera acidiphila (strain ATCC BAA-1392 / DSM 18658 / VKM B-2454 / MOB10) GN=nuoK PE=3 SV=1: Oxidored_q2 [Tu
MISLYHYLAVGAALFALGLIGFLSRRNLILMFLSAEMMLQGVTLNLVAFSRYHTNMSGQVFTLFVVTVAACEAGLAMALILMLYKRKKSLDVSLWQDLREPGQDATIDSDPLPPEPEREAYPTLTPAGREPARNQEATYV